MYTLGVKGSVIIPYYSIYYDAVIVVFIVSGRMAEEPCSFGFLSDFPANIVRKAHLSQWFYFNVNCLVVIAAYGKVFLVRKLGGRDCGNLYAMKVLKKASIVTKNKTTGK